MNNYAEMLGAGFDSVIKVACRYLPENVANCSTFDRRFDFYHNDAIPLDSSGDNSRYLGTHKEKIAAATADLKALLADYDVTGGDTLCYPSIDFYSLYALSECADELRRVGSPTIMIRFIGVMETAASGAFARPMRVVLALTTRLLDSGLPLKIAAETPRYADFLAIHLDTPVAVAPNIETREQLPLPSGGKFTVVCPGSARFDKGFLSLLDIFSAVRRRDPQGKIQFVTQVLPDRELKSHLDYLRKLHAVPGVTVLPAQISSQEIADMYKNCDLVLLPYARDVYEFRGSAVMIEAICSGRQVVALDGPAFVDQLRYFGAGSVVSDVGEIGAKIVEHSEQPPQVRFAQARQTRERFMRDLDGSYRHWAA
jgi:glycosyltransferase involved in cell wall biosynthesis